jgi:hypothetical protein
MADLVQRVTKMGIVPEGETIEGAGGLTPVAFVPKYLAPVVGLSVLFGFAFRALLNTVLGPGDGSVFQPFVWLAIVLPQMVGMPTRHPEKMAGGKPSTGTAALFPKEALLYVATDQRLLAFRMAKADGFRRDRQIVASVPWNDVVGVYVRNRRLWTLFTFGFADDTLLTLSRGRTFWKPGGLAFAVNLRAAGPRPAVGL